MSFDSRLEALRNRHRTLDEQVVEEQKRVAPDTALLTQLKREKLRVKEEIDRHLSSSA